MGIELPEVEAACDAPGCKDKIDLLSPHLTVQVRPVQQVLLSETIPASGDRLMPEIKVSSGKQMGRAALKLFHDFDCAMAWFSKREGKSAVLEPHHEEGDMYVPEDNRSPEDLVKDGELPPEVLALHAAMEDFTPQVEVTAAETGGGDDA